MNINSTVISTLILVLSQLSFAANIRAVAVFKQSEYVGATPQAQTMKVNALVQNLRQEHFQVEKGLTQVGSAVVVVQTEEEFQRLSQNPHVAFAEKDILFPAPKPVRGHVFSVNQPLDAGVGIAAPQRPWGIDAVKATQAWKVGKKGLGARVMILDTGIDKDHPALKANILEGSNFVAAENETTEMPYPYADLVGHGTHVAGTIAAVEGTQGFAGVAPEAKIMAGRVCSELGCSTISIVQGINWAIEQNVDVISMSLGSSISPPSIRNALSVAEEKKIVVVAASGNDGTAVVGYPAALPSVIAVGAIGADGKRASFSQYGPELDVVAPGVEVTSSLPLGTGRESVVTINLGAGKAEIANSPVGGTGEFTGRLEGEMIFAGIGKKENFSGLNVRGKVVLMARGEITFTEKVLNAMDAGAKAVIVHNNEPGLIRGGIQAPRPVNIPVFMILQSDGLKIQQALSGGKKVSSEMFIEVTDYGALDGTSMATPHVSGVVALIRATNKGLTPAAIRALLKKTAVPMPSPVNENGAGLVDAAAAVSQAAMARISTLN